MITKSEIEELAEALAYEYGEYQSDNKTHFPVHFYICESGNGYSIESKFSGTPENTVAYIGELQQPPELSGEELKNNCMLNLINDIENAEWL